MSISVPESSELSCAITSPRVSTTPARIARLIDRRDTSPILGASILVAHPGEAILSIRICTLIANAPPANVAALALLHSAVIISPLMLLAWGVAAREAR